MKTVIGSNAAKNNASLCDLLDRLINVGVVARGSIIISVAGIELIYIELSLLIATVESAFGDHPPAWSRQGIFKPISQPISQPMSTPMSQP